MTERQVSVLIADDLLFSLTGKMTLLGVYTADLVIPVDEHRLGQLVFLFVLDGALEDQPQAVTLEITLPGDEPRRMQVPVPTPQSIPEGRTRWMTKWPFLVQQPTLRPGRIIAKVIHERGEMVAATPWIIKMAQTPPSKSS